VAQIIQRCQDDEELMSAMLEALEFMLNNSSDRSQDDMIFTCIEAMINDSTKNKTYSTQIIQKAVAITMGLKVTKDENKSKLIILAYFFNKTSN
jgi:hypothetical protein